MNQKALAIVEQNDEFGLAISTRDNEIWKRLSSISLTEAISHWLATFGYHSKRNYQSGMNRIIEQGLLSPNTNLQTFALMNHESILDHIKQISQWSESTRQARAACYISFTNFLSRRFPKVIRKAIPSKEGNNKTFFKVREKVKTRAMTQSQWLQFLRELNHINPRDCLIAKLALQGGKRISEVLSLKTNQVDLVKNEVTFIQSKTRGHYKESVITYPQALVDELATYIGNRNGLVFITRGKKPVMRTQLANSFERAGMKASIPFKVTPHVLRTSLITYLRSQGFSDSDILKVTGHVSVDMIQAYDKSSQAENITKSISLF